MCSDDQTSMPILEILIREHLNNISDLLIR
jgi:hypothetical protein